MERLLLSQLLFLAQGHDLKLARVFDGVIMSCFYFVCGHVLLSWAVLDATAPVCEALPLEAVQKAYQEGS